MSPILITNYYYDNKCFVLQSRGGFHFDYHQHDEEAPSVLSSSSPPPPSLLEHILSAWSSDDAVETVIIFDDTSPFINMQRIFELIHSLRGSWVTPVVVVVGGCCQEEEDGKIFDTTKNYYN